MLKRSFNHREARPLYVQEVTGRYRKATDNGIIDIALEAINKRFTPGTTIDDPWKTKAFIKLHLGTLPHEIFGVRWLDNNHSVIAFEELFRGTLDATNVYPREIVKAALSCNAAACIFTHNHPSGLETPSDADKQITHKIKKALNLVHVKRLDHIIVAENHYSFAENGLI